jgi:hypothetical protein
VIQGPREHGVDGLINLFGIESPGLTSSLAIADHVGQIAGIWTRRHIAKRCTFSRDATKGMSFSDPAASANRARPGVHCDAETVRLVQRFGGVSQPLDLVLHHQFATLQFDYLQVVRWKVDERFVQFVFEALVFPFQFNEMCL